MKKYIELFIFIFLSCSLSQATTWNVNSSQSTGTIQGIINGAAVGDTVSFGAGTYSTTASYTLKCGLTYTGPVATPATVTLASTFGQSNAIFRLLSGSGFSNPCTQATTIEYFNFKNSGGIYVQTSFTNLTIVHNQYTNIPCCNSPNFFPIPGTVGIYIDGSQSTSNTAQTLTNTLIQWNTIGDPTSCLSPQSTFSDFSSPDGNGAAGACNGIIMATSINGLTIKNNNFVHISEGTHITCPGGGHPGGSQPCEPTSNGVTSKNVDIEFNDYYQNKRINHEEQPQTITNVIFANNSIHDMLAPTAFSFGLSFACCGGGATNPFLNGSNNVVILNVAPSGRYGYGIEAWGKSAIYNNNLVQSGTFSSSAEGIAWGYGPVATINNNTVCGSFAGGYIVDEGYGQPPPARAGNVTGPTCSATTSITPSISPSGGAQSFPLTVTFTDAGYTSGAKPQGNTGIWYTTDNSNPVPGQGTAKYISSGGTITLNSAATVKAVGMWGAINQPTSYASGYGFTPSPMTSAVYTGGTTGTLQSIAVTSTGGQTTFNTGNTNQLIATGTYINPSSTANISSSVTWASSLPAIGTVAVGGLYTAGSTSGNTNITAAQGAITSPNLVLTTTIPNPTITSGFLGNTGSVNTITIGAGTIQFVAYGNYSDSVQRSLPDAYGNTVSSWTIQPGSSTCGTVSNTGLFTPTTAGTCSVKAICSCGVNFNTWGMTVTSAAATLQSITLTATGGQTSLTTGSTVQLIATGNYSDGTHPIITGSISSWASSDNTKATITSGGLVTAVAAGSPTFTATYQSITSSPVFPLTITSSIVLQSIITTTTGGANIMLLNWTLPFDAHCLYSNGDNFDCTTTDGHGNQVAWLSSNTLAATFTNNILKEISSTHGNGFITASASSITSNQYPMTYGPAAPAIFSMSGSNIVVTGTSATVSNK